MNRRHFLQSAALAPYAIAAQRRRPNIVLIMADDMGFSDIGCYGGEIRTPNIDGLAKGGVRFTHFYNTARCCPTRASLLTGLYAHQTGVGHMVDNPRPFPGYTGILNRNCVTIGEALKPAGYRTMMSGKWHVTPVTDSKDNWPRQRGFDRYYGIIHGAADYFNPVTLTNENETAGPVGKDYYFTDAISDHAAAGIRDAASRKTPFFQYVAYTSPHWPLHALQPDIDRYRGRYKHGWDALRAERHARMIRMGIVDKHWTLTPRDPRVPSWTEATDKDWQQRRMEVYAAQVDRMDQGIGRILAALRETGQERNTLILFLADNGGCAEELGPKAGGLHVPKLTRDGRAVTPGNDPRLMPGGEATYQSYGIPWANASNTPFRLYKHWVHEGGISSPLVASWPSANLREGTLTHQPGHLIDLMATCLDVAGAKYPEQFEGKPITPLEGRSLQPAFQGRSVDRTAPLFWEHEGNRAINDGRWKLVSRHEGSWELYDLQADRTEMNDLSAKHPDRAESLRIAWEKWAARAHVEPWDKVRQAPRGLPA